MDSDREMGKRGVGGSGSATCKTCSGGGEGSLQVPAMQVSPTGSRWQRATRLGRHVHGAGFACVGVDEGGRQRPKGARGLLCVVKATIYWSWEMEEVA